MPDSVPFRLVLRDPPPGVEFRLQSGKADLVPPTRQEGGALEFDFVLRLRPPTAAEPVRFGGPLVQGRPGGRFLYLNSGSCAGQAGTPWARRAKVSLQGLGPALVGRVQASPGGRITGHLAGTGRDGGPVCASTPLEGAGWSLAPSKAP